jgi:lipopolysaccharide transport system permease protein
MPVPRNGGAVFERTWAVPTVRIVAGGKPPLFGFEELWEHRELVYFLAWRDIKVRYKQTFFGAAWAVMQPVLTMLVFSLFFGRLAGVPSDGAAYPLFSFAALVPWGFFSYGMTQSANSLVASSNVVKKVYFPRIAIPLATVLSGAVDFVLALAVLGVMMTAYGAPLTATALWLPPLFLLTFVAALGAGLWLAALNVYYRDVRYTLPFLTQLWLFATPVAYPSSMIPEPWRTVYGLNPMAGVVEGFRWALLGTGSPPGPMLAVSALAAIAAAAGGAVHFRHMERTFADVV